MSRLSPWFLQFQMFIVPSCPTSFFCWVGEPKATGFANGPVSPKAMKEEVYKCACRSLQKATIWGFENSLNQKLDVRPFRHGVFTSSKPPVAAAECAGMRSLRLDESRFGTKKNGQFGANMTSIGQNSYYIYICIYYSDHECHVNVYMFNFSFM